MNIIRNLTTVTQKDSDISSYFTSFLNKFNLKDTVMFTNNAQGYLKMVQFFPLYKGDVTGVLEINEKILNHA